MTELFISYSRKDKEFVHKLHDALAAQKRDVWVDWEDIPLASDWRAEVFAGIEEADSFVFVLSPNSAASEVCGEEVNHAVSCQKRVIPILYQEGDFKNINPAISSHNWIYSRSTDDFDTAFKSLLQTLDTDLDFVKMHTRLLVRAREWDNKKRNPSFALRGADLQDAERWQITSAGKKPAPTLLHHDYINSSRSAAVARQRVIIGALAVGMVIAVILALFALRQSQIADQNAALAKQNGDIAQANYLHAQSQQLGIQAQYLLNTRGNNVADLAALLAIRSLKIEHSTVAESSLSQALKMIYPSNVLEGHTDIVTSVAITPDEKYVITGGADKTVRLWDATTGKEIRQFTGHTGKVTGVATISDEDGTYIFSSSDDGTVREWDLEKGTEIGQLIGHTGPVTSVRSNGVIVVTTGADKTVRVWDAFKRTQYKVLTGHSDVVTCADISYGGRFVATGSLDKTARLWDVTTGEALSTETLSSPIESIALFRDLSGWAFGDDQHNWSRRFIDLLPPDVVPDLETQATPDEFIISGSGGSYGATSANTILTLLPDGKTLVTSNGDDSISDLSNGSPRYSLIGHSDSVASIATSRHLIVTGSYDDTARIWHIQPGDGLRAWDDTLTLSNDGQYAISDSSGNFAMTNPPEPLPTPDEDFTALAFSPDSKSILWHNGPAFELRNVKTNEVISRFDLSKDPAYKEEYTHLDSFTADGKVAALTGNNNGLLIDVATGKVLGQYTGSEARLSPDGQYLVTYQEGYHLFKTQGMEDISSGIQRKPLETLVDFQFSPDAKYVAYVINRVEQTTDVASNTLVLLNAATGKEVRQFQLRGSEWTFAPDGKTFLDVSDNSSSMAIRDMETGSVVHNFVDSLGYPANEIKQITFSPDGNRLLTGSLSELDVWDVSTGHRIRQFAVDGVLQSNAHLLPDGQSVVLTVSKNDDEITTIIVPMDFRQRIDYACSRLTRDLSAEERKQYGIKDSDPTCPQNSPAK
jgi:WD40 repeat protein